MTMGSQRDCESQRRDHVLLSIIVPVYNVAPYLDQCLNSIVEQTYRCLELILVDDGSTDGSGEICDRYAHQDSRVKVFHQPNQGVAAARKKGVEFANGSYIGFVDGDDYIDEELYEKLMESRGDFDLVTSRWIREDGEHTRMAYDKLAPEAYKTPEDIDFLLDHLVNISSSGGTFNILSGIVTYVHNKLYRASLVKTVMSQVDETITFGEDMDFLYRYLLICRSVLITEFCGYHYRIRRSSAAHSFEKGCSYLRNTCKLYESLFPVFQSHPRRENLMEQLQYKMVSMWGKAPAKMGFLPQIVAQPVIPFLDQLTGRKIALYGAGPLGCKYRYQIEKNRLCEVSLWVDEAWRDAQRAGYEVVSPEELLHQTYDFVVIAAWKEIEAISFREKLEKTGVDSKKILWKPPFLAN